MTLVGRGVWNRKTRVDEARSIDILELQRHGVFAKGSARGWKSSWLRDGEVVASLSYRVELGATGPTGLRFVYSITEIQTVEKKDYNYVIPVTSTPCNYGGKRWWFLCPLAANSYACHRRVRIVYLPPGANYFGCRECHRLTYESRQRHREKFYEGFEKPFKIIDAAQKELAKARFKEKRGKLWRRLSDAQATIEGFQDNLNCRSRKSFFEGK